MNGWEGLYQVSNLGRVKSLDKIIKNQYDLSTGTFTGERIVRGKILAPHYSSGTGYYQVTLSGQKHKTKQANIHKLVAQAFITNPKNLPVINHKDENKLNNQVDNLEWCTQKHNVNYSNKLHPGKISERNTNNPKRSYKVLCIETGIIYPSASEAARQTGLSQGTISNVCRGARVKDSRGNYYTVQTTGGYHWKYVKEGWVKASL